jgi:hypothetical protein
MKKKTEKIPEKSVIEALKRSKGRCEECGINTENPLHHVYFKSQYYGNDRNLSWNLVELCEYHHKILHHAGTDREVLEKYQLDYKLKCKALDRYHGKNIQPLEYELKKSKYNYENYLRRHTTIDQPNL